MAPRSPLVRASSTWPLRVSGYAPTNVILVRRRCRAYRANFRAILDVLFEAIGQFPLCPPQARFFIQPNRPAGLVGLKTFNRSFVFVGISGGGMVQVAAIRIAVVVVL
jgi:hypothetical protein